MSGAASPRNDKMQPRKDFQRLTFNWGSLGYFLERQTFGAAAERQISARTHARSTWNVAEKLNGFMFFLFFSFLSTESHQTWNVIVSVDNVEREREKNQSQHQCCSESTCFMLHSFYHLSIKIALPLWKQPADKVRSHWKPAARLTFTTFTNYRS